MSISDLFLKVNLSIFSLLNKTSLEEIFLSLVFVKSEARVQYSFGLNNSISCSLSVINFRATDCTLPADFDPGNFVHKIGEILNPTK